MSDLLTRPIAATTGFVERRRPGRIENASPELIALMRKPTHADRIRVALYDAPNFIPPAEIPRSDQRIFGRVLLAMVACSAGCTAAFKAMVMLWG